jgi:hypothetical protein
VLGGEEEGVRRRGGGGVRRRGRCVLGVRGGGLGGRGGGGRGGEWETACSPAARNRGYSSPMGCGRSSEKPPSVLSGC